MTFDHMIIWIMAIGILIGGLDRVFGNKLGLGKQFEEGFNAMGPLALGMVGIVTLAPVIAKVLGPIIIPVFTFMGADPAMFAMIWVAILLQWNLHKMNRQDYYQDL